ncbi:hypothetical protein D3C80_1396730 [compost metagenome]
MGSLKLVPPTVYFANYNFIIDSSNSTYFYSFQKPIEKGNFYCEGPFIPHFMGLMPNHIFAIPRGEEINFFEENVLKDKSTYRRLVFIGSAKDTIRNDFLNHLLQLQKDTSVHLNVVVAPIPIETKVVLTYKKNGTFYDSSKVKWDSTKIYFPPKNDRLR